MFKVPTGSIVLYRTRHNWHDVLGSKGYGWVYPMEILTKSWKTLLPFDKLKIRFQIKMATSIELVAGKGNKTERLVLKRENWWVQSVNLTYLVSRWYLYLTHFRISTFLIKESTEIRKYCVWFVKWCVQYTWWKNDQKEIPFPSILLIWIFYKLSSNKLSYKL